MKRLFRISFVLAIAVLVMLAGLLLGTRTATAASTNGTVQIDNQAQFVSLAQINVQIKFKCSAPYPGELLVSAKQTPQQSSNGIGAQGATSATANCDGNPHSIAVSVPNNFGGAWSLGSGTAEVILEVGSNNFFDAGPINIVQ